MQQLAQRHGEPGAHSGDGRKKAGPDPLMLAGILVFAFAIRLAFLSGLQGHDDRNYISYAWALAAQGRMPLEHPTQWVGRVGYWFPLAGSIEVLGLNEWALALYPLMCSMAGFVLLWKLGGLWFPERTRLLAALLLAVMPLDVLFASHAYPDLPLGFWLVLTFYLFLRGERSERGSAKWYWAAGLAAGVAYLHRMDAVYLLGPFGWYLLSRRTLRKEYAWTVVAGLLVVLAEWLFWARAADDPFFRYHGLLGRHGAYQEKWEDQADKENESSWSRYLPVPGRVKRGDNPWLEPVLMFGTNQEFGVLYYFIWPVAIAGLIRRRNGYELAIWLAGMALLLCFFPLGFPKTMARNPRYFCCLTIPGLLLLSDWLMRWKRPWRWGIVGLLVASSVGCILIDSSRHSMSHVRQVQEFMERHPEERFWMSPKDRFGLFVRGGGNCDERAAVHLLTTNSESDNFQNVMMVCPGLDVAEEAVEIPSGYVVVTMEEKRQKEVHARLGAEWKLVKTLELARDPIIGGGVAGLDAVGVPREYTRRLLPNLGERTEIWQVSAPKSRKGRQK